MRWRRQSDIPGLYAILDGDALRRRGMDLVRAAYALREAGARLVQYREKSLPKATVAENASLLGKVFHGSGATLLINDYVDLVEQCGLDGVHLGQGDLPVEEARALLGASAVIGLSTHRPEEVRAADRQDVDYVAVGPVFSTQSKADAEPCVGLDGVAAARALTQRPLVAIGGINAANAADVIAAGADSVAMIGELLGGKTEEQIGLRWAAALSAVARRPV